MKKVLILLATYNGDKYLKAQIESLIAQKNVDWSILASDDGSSDQTIAILESYQKLLGMHKISIIQGPHQGFAKNFLYLIENADPNFDYYAFSDQDDIWNEYKLLTAMEVLDKQSIDLPCLYGGRTQLIDENNHVIGYSPLFEKKPSFQNALVQSIAGGNTMVFNQASCHLLKRAVYPKNVICHDWWLYLFISGCGGHVFYDKEPFILYRQHQNNLIGSQNGIFNKLKRFKLMLEGRFKAWNDSNIENLISNVVFLTKENKKSLEDFVKLRKSTLLERFFLMKSLNVYRQTLMGNLALNIGFFINKI